MPKTGSGFKSITVTRMLYDYYRKGFEAREGELARKGITSFAKYITRMLEERMEREELFARHPPVLQGAGSDENWAKIFVKDSRTDRIAGVAVSTNGFKCDIDGRDDCVHVGFAFALPETYKMMESLGVKRPEARAWRPPLISEAK